MLGKFTKGMLVGIVTMTITAIVIEITASKNTVRLGRKNFEELKKSLSENGGEFLTQKELDDITITVK